MSLDVFILPTGRPFFDLIFADVPKWVRGGEEVFAKQFATCAGGSFNIAMACHRLGLNVGFCAHLGVDFSSEAIRQATVDAGISSDFLIEHDRPMTAVTASISKREDRGFVSFSEPTPDFDPSGLPEHGVPGAVIVPGLPDDPESTFSYLEEMGRAGSIRACDCNHVERDLDDRPVAELISRLDLFLCNEKEAATLTRRSDPEQAAEVLGALCPEVVIKLGSRGALAVTGGKIQSEPAIGIEAIETTGAGDGFDAGYIYGLLKGMPALRRLRLGNVVGGCIAAELGGTTNAPSLEKILELEKKFYR